MAYINDNELLNLERTRAKLRQYLVERDVDVSADANLDVLVNATQNLQSAEFLLRFCSGTITTLVSDEITVIRQSLFKNLESLTKVSIPNANYIYTESFSGCSSLRHLNIPNVSQIYNGSPYYTFNKCSSLRIFYAPELLSIYGNGYYLFAACTALEKIITPKNDTFGVLFGASNVKLIDYKPKSLRDSLAQAGLQTLILRSKTLVSLESTRNIPNETCLIYVPQTLISAYENGTNWSAVPNISNRLKAIEGSQYESEKWFEDTEEYRTEVLGE